MVRADIETVIDRILDYVKRSNGVTLGDLSSAVGRPSNQVERLALLLEEKGLLEVHYNVLGVRVVPKKEEDLAEGKDEAKPQDKVIIEESRKLEHEVLISESLLEFFDNDLTRRILLSESLLSDLERRDYTKEEIDFVKKELDLALKQLEAFSKEIQTLSKREEQFRDKLAQFKTKLGTIRPTAPKAQTPSFNAVAYIVREIILFFQFVKDDFTRTFAAAKSFARRKLPLPPAAKTTQKNAEKSKSQVNAKLAPVQETKHLELFPPLLAHSMRASTDRRQTPPQKRQNFSLPVLKPQMKTDSNKKEKEEINKALDEAVKTGAKLERKAERIARKIAKKVERELKADKRSTLASLKKISSKIGKRARKRPLISKPEGKAKLKAVFKSKATRRHAKRGARSK